MEVVGGSVYQTPNYSYLLIGGAGGAGTSYSGGAAGGFVSNGSAKSNKTATDGYIYGGSTATGFVSQSGKFVSHGPGGLGMPGGLLVVYCLGLSGTGLFAANGGTTNWTTTTYSTGSFNGCAGGGGSINIFVKNTCNFGSFKFSSEGGKTYEGAHFGGNGTVNYSDGLITNVF